MSCNNVIPYIESNCRKSIGGIKRIFAINSNEIDYINYDMDNSGMVNFIIPKHSSHFQQIKCVKDSASLTTTFVGDVATGSGEYTSEFVFKLVEDEYNLWAGYLSNTPIVFVLQNNRNEYYLVGDDTNGAYLTNSVHTSGANLGEFNGEEMTFTYTSDKPLWKCVVGSEMAGNIGTYPYISEELLENRTSVNWSGIEVDSGDFEFINQDAAVSDADEEYFEIEISTHDPDYIRYGLKLQMTDSGLGYYWFMKGDNNITENIVRDTRDIAHETEENITVRKKIRQYLISDGSNGGSGYLPSVKTDLCVFNQRDDANFINWNARGHINTYSQVLVFDIEIIYNTDGTYYFEMNKAQQIEGLG